MEKDSVLEMRHIYKTFPGVKALQNVDFTLKKGEIHALMGIKRLCDIVIGTIIESQNLIHIVALRCQHNNRHIDHQPQPAGGTEPGHQHRVSGSQSLSEPDGCRESVYRTRTAKRRID